MTAKDVAKSTRNEQSVIIAAMLLDNAPMGNRPKYTALKILDKEFSVESQWYWYERMATFWSTM